MSKLVNPELREAFVRAAHGEGLNLLWVISRERAQPVFSQTATKMGEQVIFPEKWESLLLLGNAGPGYWDAFQEAAAENHSPVENPLDAHTEAVTEALLTLLRKADPLVESRYPFQHPRQLYNFQGLAALVLRDDPAPCGVSVHPRLGPWFAWRAALLTGQRWPETPPETSPCASCETRHQTPCVPACPVGAVSLAGFDWRRCASYRLRTDSPCAAQCQARQHCPEGVEFRYGSAQTAHHYRASLRMLQQANLLPGD